MPARPLPPKKPLQNQEQIKHFVALARPLIKSHKRRLSERFSADFFLALESDAHLAVTGEVKAQQTRVVAKTATTTEQALRERTHAALGAIRDVVRASDAPREVKARWGVGTRVSPKTTNSVLSVGGLIVQRFAEAPEEARRLGILARDVTRLGALLARLQAADEKQGEAHTTKIASTTARNAAMKRVLKALGQLAAGGALEFADKPEIAARFAALAPRVPPRTKALRAAASSRKAPQTSPAQ